MDWLQQIFTIPDGATALMLILFLIKRIISLIGVLVILWGACVAFYNFVCHCKKVRKIGSIDLIRLQFGRTIILGLEFIVAADVIETTTAPDFYSVGILASLVAIRTLLTFFMNRELKSISKKSTR